jgi:hypothetical protein
MASTPPIRDFNDIVERFWNKVEKTADCWTWKGAKTNKGYGIYSSFYKFGFFKSQFAHRVSYFLANGNFDSDLLVCHKCDNPSCVNPNHLFIGTYSDNAQDMSDKGRNGQQINSQKGEKHGRSKLDWNKVREIRKRYSEEKITKSELSRQYGVDHKQIRNILNNTNWVE